jgi:hypothetical protein
MVKSIFYRSRIRNFESLLDPKRIVSDHNPGSWADCYCTVKAISLLSAFMRKDRKKDLSCGF